MRKLFPGYYTPKEEDFEKMWKNGLFILDTNVLLDLFRYSEDTVKELFKVINLLKDRIWIPYQVSKEYHRNLNTVISGQVKKYNFSIDTLNQFKSQIDEKRNHPFLKIELQNEISEFCLKINTELEKRRKDIKNLILNNPIKEQLADLLESKIGSSLSEQELNSIYTEGEKRYLSKTPPGYQDKSKPIPERYGDLVLWKEILKKNSTLDIPIILITGDTKEDWYFEELGLTIGPRPELIDEFTHTKNNLFYIYPTDQFLKYAAQYLETEIDGKSIDEIGEYIKQSRIIDAPQSVSPEIMTESVTTISSKDSSTNFNTSNSSNAEVTNVP